MSLTPFPQHEEDISMTNTWERRSMDNLSFFSWSCLGTSYIKDASFGRQMDISPLKIPLNIQRNKQTHCAPLCPLLSFKRHILDILWSQVGQEKRVRHKPIYSMILPKLQGNILLEMLKENYKKFTNMY